MDFYDLSHPKNQNDPENERQRILAAWLLGVLYGSAHVNEQSSKIKIEHRKKEYPFKPDDNKGGAVFLYKVSDAVHDLFGCQVIQQTDGVLSWDKSNWKLFVEIDDSKVIQWTNQYGIRTGNISSMVLPNISDDLFSHFLRGFFESNGGSIYSYNTQQGNKRMNLEFKHRSKRLLTGLRDAIGKSLDIGINNSINPLSKSRLSTSTKYALRLTKADLILKILTYMYRDYYKGCDEWEDVISHSLGEVKKLQLMKIWDEVRQIR